MGAVGVNDILRRMRVFLNENATGFITNFIYF